MRLWRENAHLRRAREREREGRLQLLRSLTTPEPPKQDEWTALVQQAWQEIEQENEE